MSTCSMIHEGDTENGHAISLSRSRRTYTFALRARGTWTGKVWYSQFPKRLWRRENDRGRTDELLHIISRRRSSREMLKKSLRNRTGCAEGDMHQVNNCSVHTISLTVCLALLEMVDVMCDCDKEHFWQPSRAVAEKTWVRHVRPSVRMYA